MEYRILDEFPNYWIYEDGTIERHRLDWKNKEKVKVMKGTLASNTNNSIHSKNTNGQYRQYKLTTKNNLQRFVYAHQLVCEAFYGPTPGPDYQVAHNDGNKDNNSMNNVRWATRLENGRDTTRQNLKARWSKIKNYHIKPDKPLTMRDDIYNMLDDYWKNIMSMSNLGKKYYVHTDKIRSTIFGYRMQHIVFAYYRANPELLE